MQILGAMPRLLEVRVRGSFLLLRGSLAAVERLEDLTARSAAGLADPAPGPLLDIEVRPLTREAQMGGRGKQELQHWLRCQQ